MRRDFYEVLPRKEAVNMEGARCLVYQRRRAWSFSMLEEVKWRGRRLAGEDTGGRWIYSSNENTGGVVGLVVMGGSEDSRMTETIHIMVLLLPGQCHRKYR